MTLSILRPMLIQRTVLRTAPLVPLRVSPIRAFSIYSPRLDDQATTTTTKAKTPKSTTKDTKEAKAKKEKTKAKPSPPAEPEPLSPGLTLPPKPPTNVWVAFLRQFYENNHERFRTDKSTTPIGEWAKAASETWHALSDEEKAKFSAPYKEAKVAFDKEYAEWFNSYTVEQRREIERHINFGKSKKDWKPLKFPGGKATWRAEIRNRAGNPGKPGSTYFMFLEANREKYAKQATEEGYTGRLERFSQISRLAALEWNDLTAEEKEMWKQKWSAQRVIYNKWAVEQGLISGKDE